MENCSLCGRETELYISGKPICLKCVAELEADQRKREPEKEETRNQRSQSA
jgi:hypothetical protein